MQTSQLVDLATDWKDVFVSRVLTVRPLIALLAVFGLVAAGCSVDAPTTRPTIETPTTELPRDDVPVEVFAEPTAVVIEAEPTAPVVQADTESTLQFASPIALFVGEKATTFELAATAITQERIKAERLNDLVECMNEQGFEVPLSEDIVAERGTDAWIETYGFGVSTLYLPQSMVGPDVLGGPEPGAILDQVYAPLDKLSGDEAEMYDEALRGASGNGCILLYTEPAPLPFMQVFGGRLVELDEQINRDSRVVAAIDGVTRCVAETGRPGSQDLPWFDGDSALFQHFVGPLWNLEEVAPAEAVGDEVLTAKGLQQLGVIQENEVAIAVALRDCKNTPDGFTSTYNSVRTEFENAFLAEHAAELAQFASDVDGDG